MIPYSTTKQVVDANNIVEVVSEYVKLKKKGSSYFGLCPFHDDKNPSMSVNAEKKVFNCFSCGTKGNVIYFVSKYENITMEQATIKLAARAGIKIDERQSAKSARDEKLFKVMNEAYTFYRFYLDSSEEGKAARAYLTARGIDEQTIKDFKIGLAPSNSDYLHQALAKKGINDIDQLELGLIRSDDNDAFHDIFRNRIMFSVTNQSGKIVGFSGRIYSPSNQAKYINSSENAIFHKGEILYNFDRAALSARKFNKIYLFEGFMDVIAVERAGLTNGVATMGTALTKEHVKLLTSVTKNIVLCFDGDEAGIKAMKRSALMLSQSNITPEAIVLPDNLDPDEYIAKFGEEQFNHYLKNNTKNVYLVLYELAYKKLVKNVLSSIEAFKAEVFDFMRMSKQETIINFFLKQLAVDLEIDVEILRSEFNAVRDRTYHNDFQSVDLPLGIADKPIVEKKRKKEVKITPGLIKAYNTVLKQSINSRELYSHYVEAVKYGTQMLYPGSVLGIQFDLLYLLYDLYANTINDGIGADLFLETIKDKSDSVQLVNEILNDPLILMDDVKQFEQCLAKIKDYFSRCALADAYNDTINAATSEERVKKTIVLEKLNKTQKKIVNKENN